MSKRIVVTGIGIVSPLGLNTEDTWQGLINGRSGIDYITSFDSELFETRIAGEVKDFNPNDFLDRKEARRMDRFTQFAAVAAQEAVRNAKLDITENNATRIASMIGTGIGGIITLSQEYQVLIDKGPSRVSPFLIPMMLADTASGRVSMMTGAKGPNFNAVSSCATGADTIGEASEIILRGEADVAITGASEAAICPVGVAGFNACSALSRRNDEPQRASRPFDSERDGFVMGEGAAVLVIESLDHALERGASPIVELIGYAAAADAYHITQPAPGGEGGARAMKLALEKAHLSPNDVEYINAHGTSTPMNDKFETMAINSVFGSHAKDLAISSTKSMTGHLLGAGGALEAAISSLVISRGIIPPTINLDNPDPECDLDYVPHNARQMDVSVVISNSLGFGGHNTCLCFRKYS
ncbi:MAG: beta-ketoacyl-ACP synthase II [SAR202 cluster bacterium]|nr:beta-ketoacyl-ACP synthase II [SAR202 cluster bacterium]|tara:strand:+ start:3838 stop:5076 length:1239 start_codon:yes stop_codon:yes gene_type:complete